MRKRRDLNVQGPGGHGESEVDGDWGQEDNNITIWPAGRAVGLWEMEPGSTGGKVPGSIRKQTELRNACASRAKAPCPSSNRTDVSVPYAKLN